MLGLGVVGLAPVVRRMTLPEGEVTVSIPLLTRVGRLGKRAGLVSALAGGLIGCWLETRWFLGVSSRECARKVGELQYAGARGEQLVQVELSDG